MTWTIKLTLTSSDNCKGTQILGILADGIKQGMNWNLDPEGPTIEARFDLLDDGEEEESESLTGDEWRQLESEGDIDRVLYWCQRGATLRKSLDAAIEGCDPDGYDGALHEEIDDLVAALREVFEAWDAMSDKTNPESIERVGASFDQARIIVLSYEGR